MPDKIVATITTTGQITLPAEIFRAWGLKPGDQIAFDPPGATSSIIEPLRKRSIFDRLEEFKLPSQSRPLTRQAIEDAIAGEMDEQEKRSRGT